MAVPAVLKWGKAGPFELSLVPGTPGDALRAEVAQLTGVLPPNQKLLCKDGWKGALAAGGALPDTLALPKGKSELVVTLIGAAGTTTELEQHVAPPEVPVVFLEDLTPEQRARAQAEADAKALAAAEGYVTEDRTASPPFGSERTMERFVRAVW